MRTLTKKQKKLLEKWYISKKDKLGMSLKTEDLPNELYEQLIKLNDFETINQAIECYLYDLIMQGDF